MVALSLGKVVVIKLIILKRVASTVEVMVSIRSDSELGGVWVEYLSQWVDVEGL